MEKVTKPISGYIMILLVIGLVIFAVALFIQQIMIVVGILSVVIALICLGGFFIVEPNKSMVLLLFGDYRGSVKANGFYWVSPFMTKKKISLRVRNFENKPVKVNDKIGNPVMIGTIVVWQVEDTFKATFDVDDYENFVHLQSDAAIRKMAGLYPYDNFEAEEAEVTLRSGVEDVNHSLEQEISERLHQATAIVAARQKIVEGAVGMVEMALEDLKLKEIIEFDDEKKAVMVSNLMVVLCSDKSASPVLNVGTLNQ